MSKVALLTGVKESQLDAYKRGAFLEKADRFSKDLPDEIPGEIFLTLACSC
jgi:hypothetical protein